MHCFAAGNGLLGGTSRVNGRPIRALKSAKMPKKLARLLVAVAVIIAVPIQGMAAISAGLCMTLGHHDVTDAAMHDHLDEQGASTASSHEHQADDAPGNAHCGPCVACCASASISGSISTSPRAAPEVAVEPVSLLNPPAVLPARLDRPPLAL